MIYKKLQSVFYNMVHKRCEQKEYLHYFTKEDFKDLSSKPITIKSSKGHNLKGYFYHSESIAPKIDRVVIFEHGMWSGHISYMSEIAMLCRGGFVVLAYDHTGCFESEGEETYGFLQSLLDLNDVISYLKADEQYKDLKIYVLGHSWGGFSTMNIPKLHRVSGVVSISGFISLKEIINQNVPFFLPLSRKKLLEYEGQGSEYATISGTTLPQNDTKFFFIHSRDDKMVSYRKHFKKLERAYKNHGNVRFLSLDDRDHNPTYTQKAIIAKNQMQKELSLALKKGELSTKEQCEEFRNKYDWTQITEQDPGIWHAIYNFLED